MKTFLTLFLVIILVNSVLVNMGINGSQINFVKGVNEQVQTLEIDLILDDSAWPFANLKEVKTSNYNSVARLYKFKNSRITKALSFKTKRNKAKSV